MSIYDFILNVIPLGPLQEKANTGQTITRADIAQAVNSTPIYWPEQDYPADYVIDEITANKGRYINLLTGKDIEAMKGDFLEYMQDHNSTDFEGSREAAGKIAFRYSNDFTGITHSLALNHLHRYYDYLEKHEPGKLVPNL